MVFYQINFAIWKLMCFKYQYDLKAKSWQKNTISLNLPKFQNKHHLWFDELEVHRNLNYSILCRVNFF